MHDPSNPTTGRGLLLFAALMLGLSLFLGVARHAWQDAVLWLSVAIFMACYATIMLGALQRFHRLLLALGLVAGGAALVLAFLATIQ